MTDYISPNSEALFGENDSQTIQNSIAAAEADGCRRVVIPRFNLRRGDTAIRLDNTCCDSTFTNVKTYGDNIAGIGTQDKGGDALPRSGILT